jgi:hypothetical protein
VGEKRIFSSTSRSFGYGYEAVRIRVKKQKSMLLKDRNITSFDWYKKTYLKIS